MPLRRVLHYVILAAGVGLLAACTHTVINNNGGERMGAPDMRSDRAVEKLLPDTAFNQKEFPRTYVIGLMHACLNSVRERNSITYRAKKGDQLCACETDARVHDFTLQQYVEASQAQWDPRIVPDAAKASAKIISECLQKVLP